MDLLDLLAVQGTDSQESSPAPQFKSINSSVLSLLHSPTLIGQKWKQEGHLRNYCVIARRGGSASFVAGEMVVVQNAFEVALRRLSEWEA